MTSERGGVPPHRDARGAQRGFRPDIQGLRAVAVLVVVAFHAGLPLPGGFTGVDVFFVISGYVITDMLTREWDRSGSISLARFYLRRAKRLTPALAIVVGVTVVASSLLLSPFDQQQLTAQTGLGALALVANFVIALQTGDYFGPAADTNALLHTWSLSVEEQFYLFFPATLLLAWRAGRRLGRPQLTALLVVCVIGVTSLLMVRGESIGIPVDSWLDVYYSPLTRAWEFAAGAALSLFAVHLPRRKWLAVVSGLAGLLLVAASMVLINASTPFPGKWTLVPVLGVVLTIAAGIVSPDNPLTRALSRRPAVVVGDWSYSLYLWHWPFIVFAKALFPLTPQAVPLAALVSFVPAVLSYRLVEVPFREMNPRPVRRAVVSVGATALVAGVLAGSGWVVADRVWVPAYESGEIRAAHPDSDEVLGIESVDDLPGSTCGWTEVAAYIGDNGLCRQSTAQRPPDLVVLGDSHASHLYPGLAEALPDRNVAVMSFQSPFMFGTQEALDLAIDSLLAGPGTPTVLVSRYWETSTTSDADQYGPLDHVLGRLTEGGLDVVVLDDVPNFPFPISTCRYRLAPVVPIATCGRPRDQVDARHDDYMSQIKAVVASHPGVRVLEIVHTLCSATTCSMLSDGQVAYSDSDHLNVIGSRAVARRLVELGRSQDVPVLGSAGR